MTEFKQKYCKHLLWSFSDLTYHDYLPIKLVNWKVSPPHLPILQLKNKDFTFQRFRLMVSWLYQISFLTFIITCKCEKLEEKLLNKLIILKEPELYTVRVV